MIGIIIMKNLNFLTKRSVFHDIEICLLGAKRKWWTSYFEIATKDRLGL